TTARSQTRRDPSGDLFGGLTAASDHHPAESVRYIAETHPFGRLDRRSRAVQRGNHPSKLILSIARRARPAVTTSSAGSLCPPRNVPVQPQVPLRYRKRGRGSVTPPRLRLGRSEVCTQTSWAGPPLGRLARSRRGERSRELASREHNCAAPACG